MGASNYFLVTGRIGTVDDRMRFIDVWPFDSSDPVLTRIAWDHARRRADGVVSGRVTMWRSPRHRGPWDAEARLVYRGMPVRGDEPYEEAGE